MGFSRGNDFEIVEFSRGNDSEIAGFSSGNDFEIVDFPGLCELTSRVPSGNAYEMGWNYW